MKKILSLFVVCGLIVSLSSPSFGAGVTKLSGEDGNVIDVRNGGIKVSETELQPDTFIQFEVSAGDSKVITFSDTAEQVSFWTFDSRVRFSLNDSIDAQNAGEWMLNTAFVEQATRNKSIEFYNDVGDDTATVNVRSLK